MALYNVDDYDLTLYITKTSQSGINVGTYNQSDIDPNKLGWLLDLSPVYRRLYQQWKNLSLVDTNFTTVDLLDPNSNRIDISKDLYSPVDNVPYARWQAGVGGATDLLLDHIELVPIDYFKNILAPILKPGQYAVGSSHYHLYSDRSHVEYITPDDVFTDDGVEYNMIELDYVPDLDWPITAAIYERLPNLETTYHRFIKHTEEFTGELTSHSRADTVDDDGTINWLDVDSQYEHEFLIQVDDINTTEPVYKLFFNKNYLFSYEEPAGGMLTLDCAEDLKGYLDFVGTSNGNPCQVFYTKYLPLYKSESLDSVTVYAVYPSGACTDPSTIDTWNTVETLDWSVEDADVAVDFDLGRIVFGGDDPQFTKTTHTINTVVTTIPVISTEGFSRRGYLRLEDGFDEEQVSYTSKTDTEFLGVTRGVFATTPDTWLKNTSISQIQQGALLQEGAQIYVAYTATPRVEYEPLFTTKEYFVNSYKDVSPYKNVQSEGLLALSRREQEVASISVSVNKSLIAGNIYGPVYLGNDYAILEIMALDADGIGVPNIALTISLDGIGSILEGSIVYTDNNGKAYATYKSPVNPDALGHYSTSGVYDSGDTVLTFDADARFLELSPQDIYLYQVTKDSPVIGTLGYGASVEGIETDIYGNSNQAISIFLDVEPKYFDDGIAYLTDGATTETRLIKHFLRSQPGHSNVVNPPTSAEDVMNNLLARTIHLDQPTLITPTSIRLIEAGAIEWDNAVYNGRKSIVYRLEDQSGDGYVHPSMPIDTVYAPLRPIDIEDNITLRYDGTLTLPDPDDNNVNVGAYFSYSPQDVTITISTSNNGCISGEISEEIQLRIELPPYMLGVYVASSARVPYGFRIKSDTFDAASAISASTFLTINSVARYGSAGPFVSVPNDSGSIEYTSEYFETGFPVLTHRIVIT